MGRALAGTRIILLVAGRNIRIITAEGELLRDFELDPNRDYQPQGGADRCPLCSATPVHDASRHHIVPPARTELKGCGHSLALSAIYKIS